MLPLSDGQVATFANVISVRPNFASPGDSGSIVARGGSGELGSASCCPAATEVGALLDVPISDQAVDGLREFLRRSRSGRLLELTFFINEFAVLSRVVTLAANLAEPVRAMLRALYERLLELAEHAPAGSERERSRIIEQWVIDMRAALLALRPHLAEDELEFFERLVAVFEPAPDRSHSDPVDLLNSDRGYAAVRDAVASLRSYAKPRSTREGVSR